MTTGPALTNRVLLPDDPARTDGISIVATVRRTIPLIPHCARVVMHRERLVEPMTDIRSIKLRNSTRGLVQKGDNVLSAGRHLGQTSKINCARNRPALSISGKRRIDAGFGRSHGDWWPRTPIGGNRKPKSPTTIRPSHDLTQPSDYLAANGASYPRDLRGCTHHRHRRRRVYLQ